MAKFVVLENTGGKSYARIHRACCGHSKNPGSKSAGSFSHGYFDTYLEARDFAHSLRRKIVRECTFCSPRHY